MASAGGELSETARKAALRVNARVVGAALPHMVMAERTPECVGVMLVLRNSSGFQYEALGPYLP